MLIGFIAGEITALAKRNCEVLIGGFPFLRQQTP